mgnify:CR=1 FL=1
MTNFESVRKFMETFGQEIKEKASFPNDKITSLREKGMNFVQIANWLNTKGYKTPRGRIFRNSHVHSIVKKRRNRLDIIQKEPTQSLSNISLRYKKRP